MEGNAQSYSDRQAAPAFAEICIKGQIPNAQLVNQGKRGGCIKYNETGIVQLQSHT